MLIDVLISLPVIGILILLYKVFLTIKNKEPWKEFFKVDMLIILLTAFVINLVFLGIIHLIFPKTNHFELGFLSLFSLVLAYVIDPINIYATIKKKSTKKYGRYRLAAIFVFLLSFSLEVSIFNTQGFNKNYQEEKIVLNSENVNLENGAKWMEDGTILLPSKSKITLDIQNKNYENVYFKFNNTSLDLKVSFSSDDTSFSFLTNPKKDLYNYMDLKDLANKSSLTIEFFIDYNHEDENFRMDNLFLKELSFNSQMPMSFNIVRLSFITGLLSLILLFPKAFKKIQNNFAENEKKIDRLQTKLLIAGGLTMVIYLACLFIFKDQFLVDYQSLNIIKTNIYYQQFDALLKGQLHLDLPVSDALLNVSNPYNPNNLHGISYYWDHAFYNGKYYCYYGIAPVIFVLFPIYYLSGGFLPSLAAIQQIGMILTLFGLLLSECAAIKVFTKKNNYPFTIAILFSSIFLSLTFYLTSYKVGGYFEGIYHIPYAYGLANMFFTFFFVLKAYKCENNKRSIYLALSGLFIVLLVLSRPNLIITFLFLLPLYLKMLLEKNTWKDKLIQFVPCVFIVVCGAIGVMILNKVRFNSFFEFGQSYQLTVTDQTNLEVNFNTVISAIVHFYLQFPAKCSSANGMPLFDASYYKIGLETHPYVSYTMGLFTAPIFLICFFIPLCFNKEDNWYQKSSLIILPLCSLIIAIITAGYAGFCVRYNLDIFPIMAFSTFITIVKLVDKYHEKTTGLNLVIIYILLTLIPSVFICLDYIFVRFDGITGADLNGILFTYSSFYAKYNTFSSLSIFIPLGIILAAIPVSILIKHIKPQKEEI